MQKMPKFDEIFLIGQSTAPRLAPGRYRSRMGGQFGVGGGGGERGQRQRRREWSSPLRFSTG